MQYSIKINHDTLSACFFITCDAKTGRAVMTNADGTGTAWFALFDNNAREAELRFTHIARTATDADAFYSMLKVFRRYLPDVRWQVEFLTGF